VLFSLEVLDAARGDCLMLHFGKPAEPRLIVIDGGPDPIYQNSLLPRLEELRAERQGPDGKLPIDMVMVSHIDEDHILGILEWFRDLRDLRENGEAVPDLIQTLWFNSFNEILDDASDELHSRLASVAEKAAKGEAEVASFSADPGQGRHTAAIVATVPQGRELRAVAEKLSIRPNLPFQGMVMVSESGDPVVPVAEGLLKLHVIGPTRKQLAKLQEDWDKDVKKHPNFLAEAAAFADRSVSNLSSIVVVAEMKIGAAIRRILLTGDARGNFIWDGLVDAGFLESREDTVHFDVLKLPHHGSNRNMTVDFLKSVKADHYVISANGENDNPDKEMIEWLAEARGSDKYTVWLTNRKMMNGSKDVTRIIKAAIEDTKAQSPKRRVVFRAQNRRSVVLNLGSTALQV
jgi:hypothetical protein